MNNNREAFFKALAELAEADPKVILIIADVGFSYLDEYVKRFPKQFINVGVTEQSMMGIAAGMALSGWRPYVYTMVNFAIMRPYEQLRNDVCFHDANVKILGVRGSVHYAFLGMSHNLKGEEHEEDLLAHLPNIRRSYPETPEEAYAAIKRTYEIKSPCYIRL